jgi:predicted dehydrogenase
MPIGFGIIGCGMISKFHARAIAELHGAKLVACYSRRKEQADHLAGMFTGRAYATQDELLADPAVDVVIVCTPSGAHMEPAVAAARAGKHVVVEKPLEITLKRCDAIIAECKKHNVVLSTIFPSRFNGASAQMKEAVEQSRFGRLTLAEAYVKWHRTQAYYDSGAWRGTWNFDGGGALMNQAIHSVDLLTWLMGPVTEVSAYTATLAHERIEVEDTAVATLRFANGALGVIEATTAAWPGYLKRIEIHGSEGSAAVEEEDLVIWDFMHKARCDAVIKRRMSQRSSGGGGAGDPSAIDFQPHARQLRDLIVALREGRAPLVDGREGRRAVEIVLAIYKSAQSGRPVALPLDRDPVLAPRATRKSK